MKLESILCYKSQYLNVSQQTLQNKWHFLTKVLTYAIGDLCFELQKEVLFNYKNGSMKTMWEVDIVRMENDC